MSFFNRFTCDECEGQEYKEHLYACRECNYDICKECVLKNYQNVDILQLDEVKDIAKDVGITNTRFVKHVNVNVNVNVNILHYYNSCKLTWRTKDE